jgi:hypothetical protein
MHSKNLTYKNGHFYENGKRIEIKEGAKVCVVANESDFIELPEDLFYKPEKKTSKELKHEIENDNDITEPKKIKDVKATLFFSISRIEEKGRVTHEFEVELLEDLYFFKRKSWKKPEFRLYDCACVVKQNTSKSLSYFEEIHAKSLNEAYKKTFVHYFGNKGNAACNAIDRFYEKEACPKLNLKKYRK